MTTAATIWVAAATGMVVGSGYGAAGVSLTAGVLLILIGVSGLEKRYLGPCMFRKIMLIYDDRDGKAAVKIDDILDEYRIKPEARQIERRENGALQLTLTCGYARHSLHRTPSALTGPVCRHPFMPVSIKRRSG